MVELLVALAIIAVLAALLFPAVKGAIGKAREAQGVANLRGLHQLFNQYVADNGKYPNTHFWDVDLVEKPTRSTNWLSGAARPTASKGSRERHGPVAPNFSRLRAPPSSMASS